MFLSRNKKNNVYPSKPQFYNIKVGFKGGSKLYRYVFVMSVKSGYWPSRCRLKILLFVALVAILFSGEPFEQFW